MMQVLRSFLFRVILCMLFIRAAESKLLDEPVCSKFHFEEKVLEKLVRIEHKMQLQDERMSLLEKTINEKIETLKETEEKAKVTLQYVEEKSNTIVKTLEETIDQTQADIKALMSNLTEEIKQNLEHVGKSDNQQSAIVAFKARGVTDKSPDQGDRLKFATEVLNVGDAFDKSTGFFTAPVKGVYLFTVQICTRTKKWYNVYIMAKSSAIGTVSHKDQDTTGTCASGDGIAVLDKGDTAWIHCESGGSSVVYEDATDWNSFSGVLIRAF